MIKEMQMRLLPEQAYNEQSIAAYVAREGGLDRRTIKHVRVLKRSIDARQRQIYVNIKARIYINEMPTDDEFVRTTYPDVSSAPRVVIVGEGPAGTLRCPPLHRTRPSPSYPRTWKRCA